MHAGLNQLQKQEQKANKKPPIKFSTLNCARKVHYFVFSFFVVVVFVFSVVVVAVVSFFLVFIGKSTSCYSLPILYL